MQTIALLGGGGGIKVWKSGVTSACPRTVQRDIFVWADACVALDNNVHVARGARHASPLRNALHRSHAARRRRRARCLLRRREHEGDPRVPAVWSISVVELPVTFQ